MKSTDSTSLIPVVIASEATSDYIRTIPTAQATSGDGSVSLDLGFPPECAISASAGGKRPEMKDVNGVYNLLSGAIQSLQAWGILPFSSDFAADIGGYPLYAIVADATTAGLYWRSTADSNTTTPGASGASWARCDLYKAVPSVLTKSLTTSNFTVPTGVFLIRFRIYGGGAGGGAGGGNSTSAVSGGGGGGAGAYLDVVISVVPGNDVSWVIGSGGTAGVNNGDSGGQGGDTIIYVSGVEVARAGGGFGGTNATLGGVGVGGVGGSATVTTASGWDSHAGAGGGTAVYAGVSQGWGGIGAASFGNSFVQVTGTDTEGLTGNSYGCGGSGGTGTSNGGAGVQGSVTYEY